MNKNKHKKLQKTSTRKVDLKSKSDNFIWIYGIHAVLAALNNSSRKHQKIICTQKMREHLKQKLNIKDIVIEIATSGEIYSLLPEGSVHQGVALKTTPIPICSDLESLKLDSPIIILDQVSDPHNIGAIMRSAAAFGFEAIIMTQDHAPSETPIIAKTACGALEILPIITATNLVRTMEKLKQAGYWCVGMDGSAKTNLRDYKAEPKTALIMGAEGKGLRPLTQKNCDFIVKLPINKAMESLNVSNASAIAMYEIAQNIS